jgi:hypothetical protein
MLKCVHAFGAITRSTSRELPADRDGIDHAYFLKPQLPPIFLGLRFLGEDGQLTDASHLRPPNAWRLVPIVPNGREVTREAVLKELM